MADPQAAKAAFDRAVAAHNAGRAAEAEALYGEVLAQFPNHPGALHLLGVVHFQHGRLAKGIPLVERALALQPDYAEAHHNLGCALRDIGQTDKALACFDRALSLRVNWPAAHFNRAEALVKLNRLDDALAGYNAALTLEPGQPVALARRAAVQRALKHNDAAKASYEAAIAKLKGPALLDALNSLGNLLRDMGDLTGAVACAERALALKPDFAEAAGNKANSLAELGRFDEALAAYDRAIALKPDYALARYNRGLLHLLQGRLQPGWADYEWRLKLDGIFPGTVARAIRPHLGKFAAFATPDALRGKRLLVVTEQGLGDEIMFAGMLRDLQRDAAAFDVLCSRKLETLFAHAMPGIRFAADPAVLGDIGGYDALIAMGSLAHAYRNSAGDFPAAPYLAAPPAAVADWKARLGGDGRRLVGLSWRGGTATTRAALRSMTLDTLRPLIETPEVRFVSLQYGDVADEVAAFNQAHGLNVEVFPREEIDDMAALAGLLANLDAVVSVQTALIHLCGATGTRCIGLLPHLPEWRYGLAADTMPWYGSVRLMRQDRPGDWSPVIARAKAAAIG